MIYSYTYTHNTRTHTNDILVYIQTIYWYTYKQYTRIHTHILVLEIQGQEPPPPPFSKIKHSVKNCTQNTVRYEIIYLGDTCRKNDVIYLKLVQSLKTQACMSDMLAGRLNDITNRYVGKALSCLRLVLNSCHRLTQPSFQVDQCDNFGYAPRFINVQFKFACGANYVTLDTTRRDKLVSPQGTSTNSISKAWTTQLAVQVVGETKKLIKFKCRNYLTKHARRTMQHTTFTEYCVQKLELR